MIRCLRPIMLALAAGLLAAPSHAAFTDSNSGLVGVQRGALAWGDYDGDGDLDLAITGETLSGRIGRIYVNQLGTFPTNINLPVAVSRSSIAWGDYDGDGDLDLAVAGTHDGVNDLTTILRNDAGAFVDLAPQLQPVRDGAVAWGDVDNDGDLDLAVTGSAGGTPYTFIYRNTGTGFEDMGAGLTPLSNSRLAFGDYDNDGDLDLVAAGFAGLPVRTILYRNQGGVFTDAAAGLPNVQSGSLSWGDYDNDGDLDLLITGNATARIYRNTGGAFADIAAGLQGVNNSCAFWGDYDNDGDLDLQLSGTSASAATSTIIRNDGSSFPVAFSVAGAQNATGGWGDFDADGDLDLALAGLNMFTPISRIYRNTGPNGTNAAPSAPGGLSVTIAGGNATFRWNRASDAQGGAPGLTYNLRIGTTPAANDLMPSMSAADGRRLVIQKGNVDHDTTWTIALAALSGGDVHWAVQAIDPAFVGSPFAEGQPLLVGIEDDGAQPPGFALRLEGANPFRAEARLAATLPRAMRAEVTIHDLAGRRVATLARETLQAGTHRWSWRGEHEDGNHAAAGVYLVRLRGEGVSASLRLLKLP